MCLDDAREDVTLQVNPSERNGRKASSCFVLMSGRSTARSHTPFCVLFIKLMDMKAAGEIKKSGVTPRVFLIQYLNKVLIIKTPFNYRKRWKSPPTPQQDLHDK